MMGMLEKKDRLRRERDILDRIENVKRLIGMETTLLTADGAEGWTSYCASGNKDGKYTWPSLLNKLRAESHGFRWDTPKTRELDQMFEGLPPEAWVQ